MSSQKTPREFVVYCQKQIARFVNMSRDAERNVQMGLNSGIFTVLTGQNLFDYLADPSQLESKSSGEFKLAPIDKKDFKKYLEFFIQTTNLVELGFYWGASCAVVSGDKKDWWDPLQKAILNNNIESIHVLAKERLSVLSKSSASFETIESKSQCAPEIPLKLFIKRLSPNAVMPTRGSPLAAGLDLSAATAVTVPAHGKAIVPTDLAMAFPEGTYGRASPRSGLSWKSHIDVAAGVLDRDYRGNIGVILFNHGDNDLEIAQGDKVAQLILERCAVAEVVEVTELDETSRGSGGFGSTDIGSSKSSNPMIGSKTDVIEIKEKGVKRSRDEAVYESKYEDSKYEDSKFDDGGPIFTEIDSSKSNDHVTSSLEDDDAEEEKGDRKVKRSRFIKPLEETKPLGEAK